jgi:RNA recognition motif-containing protein
MEANSYLRCNRFGYVQYSTVEEARNAIENMHLQVFEGRQIVVQFSHTQLRLDDQRYDQSNTLFIGNIPYECTDRDVQAIFADVRNLIDIRFAVDRRTGAPRGFCHAEFLGIDAANKAMEKLRVKRPYGRRLKVEYSQRKRVSFMAGENVKAKEQREWEREQQEQQEEDRDIQSRTDFRI